MSAFGASGTNAHVVLESAPEVESVPPSVDRPLHLLTLSAKSEMALKDLVQQFNQYIPNHSSSLMDLAYTFNTGRAHFNHRLALIASSSAEMETQLRGFLDGKEPAAHNTLEVDRKPKIAFLFTGHGSQYINMGRALYETSPIFQKAVKECEALLQPYLDVPISQVMYPEPGHEDRIASLWEGMKYTQPAQFVLAYGLVTLWKSWGIEPGAVIGHSVGEYAAACAAGVMNLADGIKLVAARGRLMESLPEQGVMTAVFADELTVAEAIASYTDRVSIAVINGPTNIVISGNAKSIESIETDLAKQEIKSKRLDVAQASHSPTVDPMLDEFERIAANCVYHQPRVEYISSLTGKLTTQIDSKYWRTHQRQAVRFADALQTLLAQGYNHLIEVGPNPALINIAQRNLDGVEEAPVFYSSLRKAQDDWGQMLNSLAGLYVHGATVDWRGFDQSYFRQYVDLPTYPFQRQRYWATPGSKSRNILNSNGLHPLLGARIRSAAQTIIFENRLTSQAPGFLADHIVNGQVILPATGYIEMFLATGQQVIKEKNGSFIVEDLVIHAPLLLSESEAVTVQVIVDPKTERGINGRIFSYDKTADQWRLHASAVIRSSTEQSSILSLAEIQSRCSERVSVDEHYQQLAEKGLNFGVAFRGLNSLQRGKNEAIARVETPDVVSSEASLYFLHPAILDAALQALAALLPHGNRTYLPVCCDSVRVFDKVDFENMESRNFACK